LEPGSAVAEALTGIRVADRTFDAVHFLRGAVAAYEAVLAAFAEADLSALADLTSADVYEPFAAAVAERHAQEDRLEWTLLRLDTAKIVDAALDGRSMSITVRFSSQFITSRRSDPDDPVGGTHRSVVDTTDDWTFARQLLSRDPNWKLVATRPASGNGACR
jgi:predicted lipid-binding transport protein (Tim44 family)